MSNKDTSDQKNAPAIKKLMETKTHTIEHELTDISKAKIENPNLETLLKNPKSSSMDKR